MIRLAAHDLRSPLLSVLGFTEIMMEDSQNIPEEYLPFVNLIHQSGEHMLQIINDILCLHRIEASHDFDSLGTINLTGLVTEACVLFEQIAQQRGQGLRLMVSSVPVMVKGEMAQLREAVNNLISNALKYSADDGVIAVRLSEKADGWVSFEVEDNGIGIAEEAQAKLFEPFYRVRTRETATIAGTGLGLALVKRIVERHTGRVLFTSREGIGSTFGFWLPIVAVERELERSRVSA
jgi:signal transduction histidine kinase